MILRLADPVIVLVAALLAMVAPFVFLIVIGIGAVRRQRGHRLGPVHVALAALSGGLTEGLLLLFADELVLSLPLLAVFGVVVLGRWQRRQRREAGWLLLGAGSPLALVALRVALDPARVALLDAGSVLWLAGGAAAAIAGAALVVRGDPEPLPPSMEAPAGQPGSRSGASIASAIREPSMIGPFGLPEIAMLVAYVATWLIVPFVLPLETPAIARVALVTIVASVLATEVYIRAMTTRSRRAFEAFSWLGEWELARAKRLLGGSIPTTPGAAERWLAGRPEPTHEELPIRIDILLLADRLEEAQSLLERLPAETPWEAFERAALIDLVDWRAGGDGDLRAMQEAASDIRPREGDDRLRAEVTIAVAKVRRLMAEGRATPDDAVKPFLDVRQLLGRRADGQVGRALRPRLIPQLIFTGIVLGVLAEVFAQPRF